MVTRCDRCGELVLNEAIRGQIGEKLEKISVLVAEIKELRGEAVLNEELSALKDPSQAPISHAVIALEDSISKGILEELLRTMKEKRALEEEMDRNQRCGLCEELEDRLSTVQQDYDREMREVREFRGEVDVGSEELRVGSK